MPDGKIAMASAGNASTNHPAGELFKAMTGVDMIHVPPQPSPLNKLGAFSESLN
jgi:tripartite-type tricarboxylate transporter receptor subunit TctC